MGWPAMRCFCASQYLNQPLLFLPIRESIATWGRLVNVSLACRAESRTKMDGHTSHDHRWRDGRVRKGHSTDRPNTPPNLTLGPPINEIFTT